MKERVNIGFIGCGAVAGEHLATLSRVEGQRVVALSDVSPGAIARLKKDNLEVSRAKEYADYREMIEKSDLDAVYILTPHNLHFEQAVFALKKGLNIYLEKPMAMNAVEASAIADMSGRSGKIVVVGYQRHTASAYRHVRDAIQSGELGDVLHVQGMIGQPWESAVRRIGALWRFDPSVNPGGFLFDTGSHLIDIVLWTTGLVPDSVFATAANLGLAVPLDGSLSITPKQGPVVSLSFVGASPVWQESVRYFCTKSVAECRFYFDERTLSSRSELSVMGTDGGARSMTVRSLPPPSNPHVNFVNSILGREQPASTAEDGRRAMEIADAMLASLQTGQAINV
jgi:predicted dehydrogenase